jgi:hypothetical protein
LPIPHLSREQVAQVSGLLAQYIESQRSGYAPHAIPLSAEQKQAMAGFFSPQLIDSTRVLVLKGERISNPDFYPMLKNLGFENLPDQSTMAAVTLSDKVVSHVEFTDDLLFHELVHVEQYRRLGIPRFAELYVRGFLSGGSYEAIPLEMNAYALGARYEDNPGRHFSVAEEISTWIAEDKF